MAIVTIGNNLKELVDGLGALRNATPTTAPVYKDIEARYREASDLFEQALEKAIGDADADYINFTTEMRVAMASINKAKKNIANISETIQVIAKVIDAAGKVVAKLV